MSILKKTAIGAVSFCLAASAVAATSFPKYSASVADAASEVNMEWGTLKIGGGGFVSGIVTGKEVMYARTDVGGAYKYNYDTEKWDQLFGFLTEADRGLLSVDAMAIDPTDDDTVYFLCGCAYFSGEKSVVFKTTDGGKTFKEVEVTEHIKVMGNGDGRQCGESIAVNPDNPKEIYAGGDVVCGKSALIKSTDGGETWEPVMGYDDLGFYENTINYPTWTDHLARAVTDGSYQTQNGVAAITISNGKVYVGTSINGKGNVHVADVKDDKFTLLSEDLPTANYPSRVTADANGDIIVTYISGLAFNGAAGGAYKYDVATGKVTDISPCSNSIGQVYSDPKNPDHMLATTCGVWSSQSYSEDAWDRDAIAWGDQFYRSTDGGATWEKITPGVEKSWGGPLQADYIQDGGYAWIRDKAIHWVGAFVIDPRNPDRAFTTSGNGTFMCEDVWGELPVYTFHPDGIEEVVSLDFASTPDGLDLSAIGDYDGFVHNAVDEIGLQYSPNMGSTSAIAVCPQDTDVWVRIAEHDVDKGSAAYYTLDRGKTWNGMTPANKGGKAAIAKIGEGKYRIFNTNGSDATVSYSDDFGETWNSCTGIPSQYGSKPTFVFVEPDDPNTVYAYATYYNSSWFYSKDEPDASDAQYKFCVSKDGGKTFTSTDICMYDQCDSAGRIAYLGEGNLVLGGGYYGMYNAKVDADGKVTVNKIDGVSYCKTVGYGCPEKEGDPNTLFFYGKTTDDAPEGIYRSTDGGKSWICINTDHIYGGTGNGNYLVGDMDEFGKVYMSTVGCGIVYGQLTDKPSPETTTAPTTVTTSAVTTSVVTTTTTSGKDEPTTVPPTTLPYDVVWGDADDDGDVTINDAVLIMSYVTNRISYPIPEDILVRIDVYAHGDGISNMDALSVQKHCANIIDTLPESFQE